MHVLYTNQSLVPIKQINKSQPWDCWQKTVWGGEQLLRFVQKPQERRGKKLWSQKWSGWSNKTSEHLFSNSKDPGQSGRKRLTRPTYGRCPKPGWASQLGSSTLPATCVWSIALKKPANSAVPSLQHIGSSCKTGLGVIQQQLLAVLGAQRREATKDHPSTASATDQLCCPRAQNVDWKEKSVLTPKSEWNIRANLDKQLKFQAEINLSVTRCHLTILFSPYSDHGRAQYSELKAECRQAGWSPWRSAFKVSLEHPPCASCKVCDWYRAEIGS